MSNPRQLLYCASSSVAFFCVQVALPAGSRRGESRSSARHRSAKRNDLQEHSLFIVHYSIIPCALAYETLPNSFDHTTAQHGGKKRLPVNSSLPPDIAYMR